MHGISFYGEDFFTIKQDSALYAEELKRLLMTNPGERVGQPYFGVGLRKMLFELADETSADVVKSNITEQVEDYMPVITLTRIETEIVNNSLFVNIGFIELGDVIADERLLTLEFENEVTE